MAIEIVDFPIKMVIFHNYVKLPSKNCYQNISKQATEVWYINAMNGDYP